MELYNATVLTQHLIFLEHGTVDSASVVSNRNTLLKPDWLF